MADESSPSDLLFSIEQRARAVNERATALSERISLFEEWISSWQGRTDSTYWKRIASHPQTGEGRFFGLRIHQSGKKWIVSYAYSWETEEDTDVDWNPLADAPVTVKILGVRNLPELLKRVAETQESLLKEIDEAASEFDGFASELGIVGRLGE